MDNDYFMHLNTNGIKLLNGMCINSYFGNQSTILF